jgi:gamma-glutamylcyclotransferase (GGCT)/AIG2-like uncharacterized protein YtfP
VSEYLFVYGTLQPGRAPAEIAPAVEKFRRLGRGRVRGVLLDLGEYPGAILDPAAASEVEGTVFELPAAADILRDLDTYEEFNPEAPAGSLFLRVSCPVTLEGDEILHCWMYVYNRDPAGARVLSGRNDP